MLIRQSHELVKSIPLRGYVEIKEEVFVRT